MSYISSSNFYVSETGNISASNASLSGSISATTGDIGGFHIGTTDIKSINQEVVLMAGGNPYISIGAASWNGDGIQLQYNSGNPRAFIGESGNYFKYNGSTLEIETPSLKLTSGGDLTIDGTVSSSAGEIGGWKIQQNHLQGMLGDGNEAGIRMGQKSGDADQYEIRISSDNLGTGTTNYLRMYTVSSSDTWGLEGVSGGDRLFHLGETGGSNDNVIAGWNFNEDSLYSGQIYFSGSANTLIVRDSIQRDIVEVGYKDLQEVTASDDNFFLMADADGEEIMKGEGSVGNGDLKFSFGDNAAAGNGTFFQVDEGNNKFILRNDSNNSKVGINTTAPTKELTVKGDISASGEYLGNQIQIYNANFQDDIATTTHYVPIGTNNFEQTTEDADEVGFVAPYDGELVKIIYRHNFDASSTTTRWTYTIFPDGTDLAATPTNRFRATVTGATTDDIKEITVSDADGASLDDMFFNKGETIVLSIRNSADVTDTSSEFHVTVVLKFKIPSGLI